MTICESGPAQESELKVHSIGLIGETGLEDFGHTVVVLVYGILFVADEGIVSRGIRQVKQSGLVRGVVRVI